MVFFIYERDGYWSDEGSKVLQELFEKGIKRSKDIKVRGLSEVDEKIPKNLILYGPPGTGKTFTTTEKALRICGKWKNEMKEDENLAWSAYDEIVQMGNIKFITFHQSYSYEEFVEGIKAEVVDGNISYEYVDGIFKEMCKRATKSPRFYKNEKIEPNYEVVMVEENIIYIKGENTSGIAPIPLDLIEELANNVINGVISLNEIGQGTNKDKASIKYDNHLLGYKSILKRLVMNYLSKLKDNQTNEDNYVLIIDEINRANISKVFGELITLIEEDKRERTSVTLPYTKTLFTVPKNLYIIGTMNTTDRSIALMDYALRRRFQFEEISSKAELLKDKNVSFEEETLNLGELLDTINRRITYLLNKDYTIGHAYFWNVDKLETLIEILINKIIPLLGEYFYEDWEKVALVLGDNQKEPGVMKIIIKDKKSTPTVLFGKTSEMFDEKQIFMLNPDFGIDKKATFITLKKIYS
ncbi:AAA family ATPase [Neobacillus sp. BF23-41]|uniref:McrB family protein n=1 Tax=Neobacillus sp. BF23-41 TaxID=3240280 RepID=UPI0034E4A1DF